MPFLYPVAVPAPARRAMMSALRNPSTLGLDTSPGPSTTTTSNSTTSTPTTPPLVPDAAAPQIAARPPPLPKVEKARPKIRASKAALTITPRAVVRLQGLLRGPTPQLIRIGVRNKGCAGLAYHLEYVEEAGRFDEVVEQDGVRVLIDSKALFSIIGSEMDWTEDALRIVGIVLRIGMDFFSAVAHSEQRPAPTDRPDVAQFASKIALRNPAVLRTRLPQPPSTPSTSLPLDQPNAAFAAILPANLDQYFAEEGTLIVDIRPHAAYADARLPRALSLSVPSTLLKRPLFSLDRLAAMLPDPASRTRFAAFQSATRILVYDADSLAIPDASNIHGLLRKFKAAGFTGELAWLRGGFTGVWREQHHLIDTAPLPEEHDDDAEMHPTATPSSERPHAALRTKHLPMSAFGLASTTRRRDPTLSLSKSLSASMARPAPGPASPRPAVNPFFDAIRQNLELSSGITERIPLRLPARVRRRVHDLPFPWLRDIARRADRAPDAIQLSYSAQTLVHSHPARPHPVATPPPSFSPPPSSSPPPSVSVPSSPSSDADIDPIPVPQDVAELAEALATQFYRIELAEQQRLMGVMAYHSRESGTVLPEGIQSLINEKEAKEVFPFSITAGVEKGAKNRYRHIWPFEHARVRLQHSSTPSPPSSPSISSPAELVTDKEMEMDVNMIPTDTTAATASAPSMDSYTHGHGQMEWSKKQNDDGSQAPLQMRIEDTHDKHKQKEGRKHEKAVKAKSEKRHEEEDDYVNASYVQPLGTARRYIATQGPLEATFDDFWRLAWQQNVHVIVMLTREVEGAMVKCGAYWADTTSPSLRTRTFGPLRLTLTGKVGLPAGVNLMDETPDEAEAREGGRGQELARDGFGFPVQPVGGTPGGKGTGTPGAARAAAARGPGRSLGGVPEITTIKRTFALSHTRYPHLGARTVVQLQYLEWPDMNVPEDARGVLDLVKEVARAVEETDSACVTPPYLGIRQGSGVLGESGGKKDGLDAYTGIAGVGRGVRPVLLHCSAGVGRTGGFIVVDAVLDAVRRELRANREAERRAMQEEGKKLDVLQEKAGAQNSQSIMAPVDDPLDAHVPAIVVPATPVQTSHLAQTEGSRTPMQYRDAPTPMNVDEPDSGDEAHVPPTVLTRKWAEGVLDSMDLDTPEGGAGAQTNAEAGVSSMASGPAVVAPHPHYQSLSSASTHSPSTFPSSSHSDEDGEEGPRYSSSTNIHRNPVRVTSGHRGESSSLGTSVSGESDRIDAPSTTSTADPFARINNIGESAVAGQQRVRTISAPPGKTKFPFTLDLGGLGLGPGAGTGAGTSPLARSSDTTSIRTSTGTGVSVPSSNVATTASGHGNAQPMPPSLAPSLTFPSMSNHAPAHLPARSTQSLPAPVPSYVPHIAVTTTDFKPPRALHGTNETPASLSAFADPVWEVVQDMREQRMSLCQSLRQYVFVHAAIVEGALGIVDEERERERKAAAFGGLGGMGVEGLALGKAIETKEEEGDDGERMEIELDIDKAEKQAEMKIIADAPLVISPAPRSGRAFSFGDASNRMLAHHPQAHTYPLPPSPASHTPRPSLPHGLPQPIPTFSSSSSSGASEASAASSIGKRGASPTELLKENKKGEVLLSKRPSIKRKVPSHNPGAQAGGVAAASRSATPSGHLVVSPTGLSAVPPSPMPFE
ncbi:hypothetical protein H0H81_004290 [Sphagnurus paluster]|uniref:protein-tyrosine-phosphatase n=1 Tax=Sphagnurus paluster TaxID=117069 RepID=A0A9P7GQI3_9AGAR|nr:hypothetical protein H0H81_004290 [Sphagnurus paluster]